MITFWGIGNPEGKYKGTRHNIGKEVLDFIYHESKEDFSFSNWKRENLFLFSEGKFKRKKINLAKNLTFMNESGKAIFAFRKKFKILPQNTVIIHDDFDLPLGKIKISKKRESAGHRGVESIIFYLGTKDFWRIRIGIKNKDLFLPLDEFVLRKFLPEERNIIQKVKIEVLNIFQTILRDGFQKAISQKHEI